MLDQRNLVRRDQAVLSGRRNGRRKLMLVNVGGFQSVGSDLNVLRNSRLLGHVASHLRTDFADGGVTVTHINKSRFKLFFSRVASVSRLRGCTLSIRTYFVAPFRVDAGPALVSVSVNLIRNSLHYSSVAL